MNAYIVEGLHVPHDELRKLQDGDEETTPLVEIDWISTLQDEPKITLVDGAPRQRYTLKSQDITGINVDMIKYSCWTNSMNNSLNSMPCSNNDHGDRLDFLENEREKTFIFEPINLTPKEPLPNHDLSDMHETYASFVYTLTCCYNSHVVLILDAYVYNRFCKFRSCFALGQANNLKEAHVGEGPIFTNHVDKARIIKREVMPNGVFGTSPQSLRSEKPTLLSKFSSQTYPAPVTPPRIRSRKKGGADPNSMVFVEYLRRYSPTPCFIKLVKITHCCHP
jgi:hypothetical protein